MRADERCPVPHLLLGRLGEASGEGITHGLAHLLGRVRGVRELEALRGCLLRRDLPVGGRERCREGIEQPLALLPDGGTGLEQRLVPEPQLLARCLLLADRAQESVALLQGPAVRGEVAPVRGRPLAGETIKSLAPQRRRARDEQHLLGGEQDGPQHSAEAGRTPRDAVHPDPLACAAGRGPHERDLHRVPSLGRRISTAHPRLDPCQLLAPADELALGRRAMAATPREEHDRLEEARLAGGVGAPHELWPWLEHGIERRVSAQVPDGKPAEDRRVGRRRPGAVVEQALRDALRQDVVRTGITTCTYASSPTGLKTPGDSGPLSSSAKRSAWTLPSTSLR